MNKLKLKVHILKIWIMYQKKSFGKVLGKDDPFMLNSSCKEFLTVFAFAAVTQHNDICSSTQKSVGMLGDNNNMSYCNRQAKRH